MSGTTVRRSPGRKGTPQAEPKSKLPQTVAEVLDKHVVLEVESIDRMYLNVIVRRLQIFGRGASIHPSAAESDGPFHQCRGAHDTGSHPSD